MSFAEKITGLLARPNQAEQMGGIDAPWYMKYGGRLLGIVGAFFCILFGLWNVVGILLLNVSCLISGIIQMVVGFVVMALEAPCCFFCIEYVNDISNKVEARPLWNRAAFYCAIALPPIILCPGLGSIFACGLIFGTGVIYGLMGLGRKASADEMRQAAVQSGLAGTPTGATTNDRASIVNNAQPFSFTGAVGTDSNV
ncbi:calcium channel flower isoform X1 [Zeugodacus cucurbitae]|uniref:Calcium channel flower n=1 Tax=Zeugodacus cucurbitae TaxID=28588 RepID=A0A0A1XQP6_ZEUCU|nr:calcium channel flower isoform X1 [Zeugodacus cucurbitae]